MKMMVMKMMMMMMVMVMMRSNESSIVGWFCDDSWILVQWCLAGMFISTLGRHLSTNHWCHLQHHKNHNMQIITEGSLEVKLPTICRDGKAEVGRVREEKSRSDKIRDGESQKRQDAGARKLRFTVFFQWFGAPEGRKVTSLKRRVRSQLARWEMKKCTPLWREAHFQVKSVKNCGFWAYFDGVT